MRGLLWGLWLQNPPDGGNADLILPRQSRHCLTVGVPLSDPSALTYIQGRPAAELLASRLGAFDAFFAALANELALELRHGTHDRKDQLAVWACSIEPGVIECFEHDAACFQLVDDVQQVPDAAREPVEFGDYQHVAWPKCPESLGKFVAAVGRLAAQLLGEDLCTAGRLESFNLRLEILISATDPRIPDSSHNNLFSE